MSEVPCVSWMIGSSLGEGHRSSVPSDFCSCGKLYGSYESSVWNIDARWAPTGYKWGCNPCKWPYKWVTGILTLLIVVIAPFTTGRGPPCANAGIELDVFCVHGSLSLGTSTLAYGPAWEQSSISDEARQRPKALDQWPDTTRKESGDSWMYPLPTYPYGKSLYKPYIYWVFMGYYPQESLENTINTKGTLLGVITPNCPLKEPWK